MSRNRLTISDALRAVALVAIATFATADCIRPGDRVLLVNTRPVGCTTDPQRLAAGVEAAERVDCRWNATPFDAAMASLDPTTPIVFYVHGNQLSASDAKRCGLDVYERLVRCAEDDRPIQFIVFSWSSDKVPGLLKDFREKAARTKPVAYQFAWMMGHLPQGSNVGLIGYSYGARVCSGAAHLAAGGSLGKLRLDANCPACGVASVRAVFLAAAYDACWNAPRGYHGLALNRIDTLLSTIDPVDPAMKFYRLVTLDKRTPAVGGVGPRGLSREQAARVKLLPVASSVGRSHDIYDYLAAPGLMRAAWRRVAFADVAIEPEVVTTEAVGE
jgi:hypothetical protein